jgi:hypothetical protein
MGKIVIRKSVRQETEQPRVGFASLWSEEVTEHAVGSFHEARYFTVRDVGNPYIKTFYESPHAYEEIRGVTLQQKSIDNWKKKNEAFLLSLKIDKYFKHFKQS